MFDRLEIAVAVVLGFCITLSLYIHWSDYANL